jgi:hypothetical protein
MLAWTYEAYEGIGPESQPLCAIPMCNRPTETRGLCNTCYQSWHRHGMAGLERRAARCAGLGTSMKVPLDVDAALVMLTDTYEMYLAEEDDAKHEKLKKRLVKICDAIGNVERRKRQRKFRDIFVQRKIKEIGIEAWRAQQAATQRACRRRRQERLAS